MEHDEKIQRLDAYKKKILDWKETRDPGLRSLINQETPWVRREVIQAACHRTITVGPPPAVGGPVMSNIDPFEVLFDPPYRLEVSGFVFDMIDQTIGILRADPRVFGEAPSMALRLEFADLHPAIQTVAGDLLEDGHYSEAVGRAAKELNSMVRKKSGRTRDDGVGMMHAVFSVTPTNGARLLLNNLTDQSKRDEQEGIHFLMAGVQAAIANVDKHAELGIAGLPEAMQLLALISFLAGVVDRCKCVDSS